MLNNYCKHIAMKAVKDWRCVLKGLFISSCRTVMDYEKVFRTSVGLCPLCIEGQFEKWNNFLYQAFV